MRWTKTKQELDDGGVLDTNERKKLFREYKTKKELEDDLKDPDKFEKWITYPDDDPFQKPFALNQKARRKYEIFVGGFLYYHDKKFKQYPEGKGITLDIDGNPKLKEWRNKDNKLIKDFEHYIYFEWLPKGKGNKTKTQVIIHINPTPPEFNPNPPPPPPPPPPESNG